MKPNFLIIGAARSGTTSLFKYLELHPDIFMSDIKEINFFSNEKYWNKGLKWYETHFSQANHAAVGEASTSYTSYPFRPHSSERIFNYQPDMKLIYVLRDPIDRLISHYLHRLNRGTEHRELSDIIANYPSDFLLTQGKYYFQLEQYLRFFPKESIHLLTIENLKEDPKACVKSVYVFLDIDQSVAESQAYSRHNINQKITRKNWFGQSVLNFYHRNIEQINYPYRIKKAFLKASEWGATEVKPPDLSDRDFSILFDYFRDDIKNLKEHWSIATEKWRDYE